MASRLKSVVRSLNAKAHAKPSARPQFSETELREMAGHYGDIVAGRVSIDVDMSSIPERLRITDDMPAREAAARYAELIETLR